MAEATDAMLTEAVFEMARPLGTAPQDYDPLLDLIGDARFVLIGEASHGTHEFYSERAEITKRLIREKRITAVALEADWPDAYRVNRYVRGASEDATAADALVDFRRFPQWMWRNTVVVDFVEWLRGYNLALPADAPKVGFYGLDMYSLRASMNAVLRYVEGVDPDGAKRVKQHYACFDQFGEDTRFYGLVTSSGLATSCREGAIQVLLDLQKRAMETARREGGLVDEELFNAEQNALVVKNAEEYYRTMFLADTSSWNLRDGHMVETLEALAAHLDRQGARSKFAIWAHNSHLGDARATEMGVRGELNVGQLVREKYAPDCVLIGFTTHHGTVTAATDWDGTAERKTVRPALPGSYERTFHALPIRRFLLTFAGATPPSDAIRVSRLERAIGVIYRPETERASHYFLARLADQFDAVIHFDETRAVEPLERTPLWVEGEVPETFPFAV
jgi:erythromycin esterase-like protein